MGVDTRMLISIWKYGAYELPCWLRTRLSRHFGNGCMAMVLVAAFAMDFSFTDDDHSACHSACQCICQCHANHACPPSEHIMVKEAAPVSFVVHATRHFELLLATDIFRPPIV